MHFTLHITTGCNMRCHYCYSPPIHRRDMTEETAIEAVEFAAKVNPVNAGIIFFGGEPLLKKELIKSTVEHCEQMQRDYRGMFHYKVSTNGTLLDEEFLKFAHETRLQVALSIDGVKQAHDEHRRTASDEGTFDLIAPKIDMLLKFQPYANALVTVSPETLPHYADSVEYLINKGFKYLIVSLNYAGEWKDSHLKELKKQYGKLAKLYEKWTLDQKKFYFSPFEVKFASHIRGEDALCHRCHLGMRQISVAPDGDIYPCVQFVGDGVSLKEFNIGNIRDGINEEKRKSLYERSREVNSVCEECAVKTRCNNTCSCLNRQTTGSLTEVSPVLCETERILIPIVDKLGERLYKKKAAMFIQKHYNAVYPILSLIDDMTK